MSFKKDISIGKMGEKFARKQLEKLGYATKDGDGKKVDFWLIVAEKEIPCEVKFDVYAEKSGNLAIEYYNTKSCKPSGISSTTCELWFHVLGDDEIYYCRCKDLLDFTVKTKPFKDVSGGDQNSQMYLYRKDAICGVALLLLDGTFEYESKK